MIRILGDVVVAGRTDFRTRKCRELLGILVCHRGRAISRETLGELLWPGEDPSVQRSRLRYELCMLRRHLSREVLQTQGHDFVRMSAPSDYEQFIRAACQAMRLSVVGQRVVAVEEALAYYQGELLPGHFSEWVLMERQRLEGLREALLMRLQEDLPTPPPSDFAY
ncbi:AfsR/SARP family transcriptional regulator [Armatimonas rosea]|uniref:DNA-binding SARP family transcriptional activator n=1 Tax=Armatimonas rosea TaxID=685828 RepID=A0A7W9SPF5_ARMRO|nr:winged helix-turn-helix domain-containing protein [Armatimonas rosea]MBB6050050.1 DNA-binding SARP family transcriptional activator [Armatimonas rosea]